MGCQTEVYINDYFTFSVCTHDPDTGVLTDADAVPNYLIYEDETAVAILTGNMAALDPVNTTGFYTERIQATAAAGFEAGRSYTVYIEATVDGDTGGICYGLRAMTSVLDEVVEGAYTLRGSVRIANAALAGKSSGGFTTMVRFRDINDTTTRINAQVNNVGDRLAVALDVT